MPQANPAAFAFLANRRSYPAKLFKGPVPSKDALMAILTAAVRVPDHGKLEPWRLVILQKPAMVRLADLAERRAHETGGDTQKVAKGRGQYDLGALAVVVIACPKPSEKVPPAEQFLSAGALCMNIVNAAEAAGWGANWLSGWPAHDAEFIAKAFDCCAGETVAGIVHIGTPGSSDLPDRPRPDLAHLISYAPG